MRAIAAKLRGGLRDLVKRTSGEVGELPKDFAERARNQIVGQPKVLSSENSHQPPEATPSKQGKGTPKENSDTDQLTGLKKVTKKQASDVTLKATREGMMKLKAVREELKRQRDKSDDEQQIQGEGPSIKSSTDKNKLDPAAVSQMKQNALETGESRDGGIGG